ncbi:hypothetical protein D3C76_1788400 [compost metagenome]
MHTAIFKALHSDGLVFFFGNQRVVIIHHLFRLAVLDDRSAFKQDGAVAKLLNSTPVMGNDKQ